MDVELFFYILMSVIFGFFLQLLYRRIIRKNRWVPSLLFSVGLGFIAFVLRIIVHLLDYSSQQGEYHAFNAFSVILFVLQTYFWHVHIERTVNIRLNRYRYVFVLFFAFLAIISLGLIIVFWYLPIFGLLWFLADCGSEFFALFVFSFGFYVHYRSYKYNQDMVSKHFFGFYGLAISGFIILTTKDIIYFITNNTAKDLIQTLNLVGNGIALLGLMLLMIFYVRNVDYIYTIPWDTYTLLVAYKDSGNLISQVKFKVKDSISVDAYLMAGMLNAMNNLYGEIFQSDKGIYEIVGSKLTLLFQTGENILVVAATQRTSYYLRDSLKRFLEAFEKKYHKLIVDKVANIRHFKDVEEILTPIFPSLKINYDKD